MFFFGLGILYFLKFNLKSRPQMRHGTSNNIFA
jgi:hypothetical protein